MAGLSADLERCMLQRFEESSGLVVRTAHSGEEALVQLAQDDYALLILDDSLRQPPAEEVLARSRHEMGLRRTKAIYCLETARLTTLSRDFAKHLQSDDQMLFHPLQLERLVQEILWISGGKAASTETQEPAAEDELSDLSEEVWCQFQGQIFEQVATIEEAGCALLDATLTVDLCDKARREAHKLAGSLGSLGFEKGTRLAREIEQILQARSTIGKSECLRVCDAVFELRELLERGPGASPDQETGPQEPVARQKTVGGTPLLLVVDSDEEIGRSLAIEAPHFGLRVEAATTLETARDLIAREPPGAVLLDPGLSEGFDQNLKFASELTERSPSVPILIVTECNSLDARLSYVRSGARILLEKPLAASQVLDGVVQLLGYEEKSATRVLVLDHDPAALPSMAHWLETAGVDVRTFDDPLQFWHALQGPTPHALVMDADVPRLGGVDMCRVLRNDPRWKGTPVLISTTTDDPEMVRQAYAAGADDLVVKPMAGPELLARIAARLDRTRELIALPERDSLSGLESFRSSLRVLDWMVRLGRRQKEPLCLVVLGLDDLERIFDSDQSAVHQLYARLGRVLLSAFRSGDVVSRSRDDEFLVALYGMTRSDGVQRIAELLETMRNEEPARVSGARFRASFSAGVAQSPQDGSDLRSLHRAAAQAMREATKRGGDRVLSASACAGEASREPDVVLVDDDETLTGLLRHTLETRGYRTESFTDGKAALEELGGPQPHLRPHVLLLDVDLPSMDGLTVLRRLAEDGAVKKTRVIMLTARSSESEIVSALESGAFDHVAKPFSLRVLVQRVRRAMEV